MYNASSKLPFSYAAMPLFNIDLKYSFELPARTVLEGKEKSKINMMSDFFIFYIVDFGNTPSTTLTIIHFALSNDF